MYIKNDVSLSKKDQMQTYKKRKRELNSAPNKLLKDARLIRGNLSKDTISFGSPVTEKAVIWKNATTELIEKIAKFIEKFEDFGTLKVKNGEPYSLNLDSEEYNVTYLGDGIAGDVYKVSVDGDNKYVIKKPKKKICTNTVWGEGGIKHEFEMLEKYQDNTKFQQGITLMETWDGNFFMVSKFVKGKPAGKNANGFNELTKEGIKDTLNILDDMDNDKIFNADWNINNIFYLGDDPKMLDLQWAYPTSRSDDFFHFICKEKTTNKASYEMGTVGTYMRHLYEKTGSKSKTREFLKTYLMERAKHCDTSNELEAIRKAVYQNPTEDVLDVEILRLSVLKNHVRQFLYLDKRNEERRDMLCMLRYQARGNFAAKQLKYFQPQRPYSQISPDEKVYFQEMQRFGLDWHVTTKQWYKDSIDWMKELVGKTKLQNKDSGFCYWPELFGTKIEKNNFSDKIKLYNLLSDGAQRKYDDGYNYINKQIDELESRFIIFKNDMEGGGNPSIRDRHTFKIKLLVDRILQ